MNRREALKTVAVILGGSVISAPVFLSGCRPEEGTGRSVYFAPDDIRLLDEISETMIPETDTPGAKTAEVGVFMAGMAPVLYDEKNRESFVAGLAAIRNNFQAEYGHSFLNGENSERLDFLNNLDQEVESYNQQKKEDEPEHYFRLMKELALLGFLTSEAGSTQALRYVQTPGRYDGCIPYRDGDKAWAV
ncbi:MAG: gluconate 2-dehydrogenase subunit 3 family protein [Balneolales bacterium]